MLRSLRLRFFLITWPLVVVAVAGVALAFDRWASIELQVVDDDPGGPSEISVLSGERRETVDSALALVGRWDASTAEPRALVAALRTVASGAGVDFVVTDPAGEVLASTDERVRLETPAQAPGSTATFSRTVTGAGTLQRDLIQVAGLPVAGVDPGEDRALYVLPTAAAVQAEDAEEAPDAETLRRTLRADARRTLGWAFAVASLASAVLALVLARPLVAQIGRLAEASASVRGGDLSVRVAESGHDELGELERSFNAMTRALHEAELHKRTLVTDVAHELRTPLTNVVGMIEALQDGLRKADADTLNVLRAEAGLLMELVDDLQELSLAESGQMAFDLDTVDVAAEARSAVAAMTTSAEGVTLLGPSPEERLLARADARRLGQVLRNLLRNALMHTPEGGRVAVSVRRDEGSVAVLVEDSGSGIPADQLERIWERFHRVDPSRDRASGGRGLGLAIVRHLVEGMGGTVAVASEVGRGSRFVVRLPASE